MAELQSRLGLEAAAFHMQAAEGEVQSAGLGLRAAWAHHRQPLLSLPVRSSATLPRPGMESLPDAGGA